MWTYPELAPLGVLGSHRRAVTAVVPSPDEGVVATASAESSLQLWDLDGVRRIAVARGDRRSISHLAFRPDGEFVVAGGYGGVVGVWRVPSLKLYTVLTVDSRVSFPPAFSSDGRLMACCGFSRHVHLWDAEQWRYLGAVETQCTGIMHVTFTPDGGHLAVSGRNQLLLIRIETGRIVAAVDTRRDGRSDVAISEDGAWIVKAAGKGWVRMWRLGVLDTDTLIDATLAPEH
jgi:WD40 repeat protein